MLVVLLTRGGATPLPDDACIACGSTTDKVDIAPGVYWCGCGYEGGPGMRDWQWQKRVDALAKLTPEARAEQRSKRLAAVREALAHAKSELESSKSIVSRSQRVSHRASLHDEERQRAIDEANRELARISGLLHGAIADLEVARHIDQGTGQLDALREQVSSGAQIGYSNPSGEHARLTAALHTLGRELA